MSESLEVAMTADALAADTWTGNVPSATGKPKVVKKLKAKPAKPKRVKDAKSPAASKDKAKIKGSPKARTTPPKANGLAGPPAPKSSYPAGPSATADLRSVCNVLGMLADPTRLGVIKLIVESPDGKLHVGAMTDALHIAQAAVSHHLALLRHSGVLIPERRGKNNFYALAPGALESVTSFLGRLVMPSAGG